jgi:hypothetical protein
MVRPDDADEHAAKGLAQSVHTARVKALLKRIGLKMIAISHRKGSA